MNPASVAGLLARAFPIVALLASVRLWPNATFAQRVPLSTAIYSADGELLRVTLAADDQYRLWTPLSGMSPALVESFLRFPVQDTTVEVVLAAIATSARFGIAYWDAAIVEAARASGCEVLLTEDLGDGQDYAGVRVVNPFAAL